MSYHPPAPASADFTFGGEYQSPPPSAADFLFAPADATTVEVVVAGFLPALTFSAGAKDPDYVWGVTLAGALPPLRLSSEVQSKAVAHLLFEDLAPASADLVFGGGQDVPAGEIQAHLAAKMPALIATIGIVASVRAELVGVMPAMTIAASMAYKSNTARPLVGQSTAPWQVADRTSQPGVTAGHQDSVRAPTGWAGFWERATGAPAGIEHRLPDVLERAPVDHLGRFQDATRLRDGAQFPYQEASRAHLRRDGVFQDGSKVRDSTDFRHQDGDRTKRTSRLSFFQDATGLSINRGTDFQAARPAPRAWETLFQDGAPPPPGIWVKPIDPPEPPCYLPDPHLLFSWPWGYGGPHLVFQCGDYAPDPEPGSTVVVPIKEVYLTINNATLFRLDNSAIIPTSAMSMSLDVDSWTWSFSAAVRGDALGLLQPNSSGDPVVVQASINSVPYRFVVENLSRERSFNSSQLRVSGRGLSAALDAPYSATQTFNNSVARTAQQLIADALTVNGVPMAWTVDWGITDWLVPANVFSHQGSYQTAINTIAQAAGAYVQPHNTEQRFSVLSKYPTTPWTWDEITADYEIPADVASVEGIQWADKPLYNRVYVHGQEGGVLGRYSRSGSAGDLLAPTVVDPLITHADAVRQRGRSIIGDTGRIATVSLRMPILAETGIIKPGSMIRYNDGTQTRTGISRSVSVDVAMPTIYQTIGIETHV